MKLSDINIGDIVQLNSGGLFMTVSDINTIFNKVHVIYMKPDGTIQTDLLSINILRLCND